MKEQQLSLFTDFAHRARNSDPGTSKAAAASITPFAGAHQMLILQTLQRIGQGTFEEIARAAHLTPTQTWKRLSELEELKLIYKTDRTRRGTSGRQCTVWEPSTPANDGSYG